MSSADRPHPATVAELLRAVMADPGRPRLTWYGADGERVELSGQVLDNWVAKTTNLLVEELDAGPGRTVLIDLPAHWRTVVWALATWRSGATVLLPERALPGSTEATTAAPADGAARGPLRPATADDAHPADERHPADAVDVVVSTDPDAHADAAALIAVALPALARRYDGPLPVGAIDAAGAVMTYGDRLGWVPATDDGRPALVTGTSTLTHGELLAAAADRAGRWAPNPRLAVVLGAQRSVAEVLLDVLACLGSDGSAVLVGDPAVLAVDPARLHHLIAVENVTDRV